MIALGADHAGYYLKEAIKKHLDEQGKQYKDFGCFSEESVDYAVYAQKVADSVAGGESQCGILCCGTGIGMSIAANKVKGIRASVCTDEYSTEMTRRHNDANILTLGGRVIDAQKAVALTDIFLSTEFEGGKHKRRIDQIAAIENGTAVE